MRYKNNEGKGLLVIEVSKEITDKLNNKLISLKNELSSVDKLIQETAVEFKEAASQGDHSENAAYSEAKDKLTKLNTQLLYLYKSISDIEAVMSDNIYVSKSYIDLYSTFILERIDTGEISTWKVFPGSISDIEIGIMSSESSMYKLLQGKEVNDIVITKHRISGKEVHFKIIAVY